MTTPIDVNTPTTGRKRNINIWKKIRVFLATDPTATITTTGVIDPQKWAYLGLMASGSTLGKAPEITRNAINAFGEDFIMNDVRFTKDVRTFTALEEMDDLWEITHPGSTKVADGSAGVIVAPEVDFEGLFLFEATNSWGDVYYEVTRNLSFAFAQAGQSKGDDGAATTEVTVEVPKGQDGGLYDYLVIREDGADAPTNLEPIRITAPVTP